MATVELSKPALRIPRGTYRNEPATDFTQADNARHMREALARVRAELGREYDMVIGDKLIRTSGKIKSLNPAHPSQVVGVFQQAEAEHVGPAVQAATAAFDGWRRTSVEERAGLLHNVAAILRQRKFEFCAWMVYEVGKNWAEADADLGETIDFAEFYAREAIRLSKVEVPVQLPGERDTLVYVPLGVGAVIPPWNFPCAIMAGMTMASLVFGDTGVFQPSHRSPGPSAQLFEGLSGAARPRGA